ncbi:hypothetical protein H8356DRAFT_1393601 [Neocallimastix lanati (nom. inval.)]|nr:hypothetical protein H8356DRAFT_1393601 [Neocallimastix sp. JGI-2020a]
MENKLYVIKGLTSDINDLDEKRLTEEHVDSINKIYEYIYSNANRIKNYESFEGHEQEVREFITLNEYYNDLVSFINEKYGEEYYGTINKINIEKELNDQITEKNNLLNKISVIQNYHAILNDLNYKLQNDDIDSLSYNEFSTELMNLEQSIYEGIQEFLKIKNPNHHYSEATKLVDLLNSHNKLVAEYMNIINNDNISKLYGKNDPFYIYNDNELTNKLKYLIAEKYIEALSNILENNKEKFNIDESIDIESFISNIINNSDKKLKFSEGYELPEINIEILNKIFNKNFNSEIEAIDYININTSDKSQLTNLKESYELKRKLIEHEAPTSKNMDEVKTIKEISEKLGLNNENNSLMTFQSIIYEKFIEFLEASSQFDDYVRFENLKNDENGNLDISFTYINENGDKQIKNDISDLFEKLDFYVRSANEFKGTEILSIEDFNEIRDNAEKSIIKLNEFISTYVSELSKCIDKENSETFNNGFTYLEKFVKSAENFIETTSEICQNEDLKNSISENIEKLREFKNLNDQYEEETKHHSDKSITISVPNLNQNNDNLNESYEQTNIEEKILGALRSLKKYDSKNTIGNSDEANLQDSGEILKALEKALKCYIENISNIESSKESTEILINLYDSINALAYRYVKSEFIEDRSIRSLNNTLLDQLSKIFEDSIILHQAKFENKLLDNNSNEIKSIIDYKLIAETESKYVNDMLHAIYNEVINILGETTNDVNEFDDKLLDNMEKLDNGEVNKVYNSDRRGEFEYLRDKLKNYKIDESDKDHEKEIFMNVYQDISEIENVFDRENSKNSNEEEEYANNSEAVYTLSDSIYTILKDNFDEDDDVKNLRGDNYNSNIGNKNKLDIRSTNELNLDYIIKTIESNYFIEDSNYRMYVTSYFTYLKNQLLDSVNDEKELEKNIEKIKLIRNQIEDKIKIFTNYDSPEGHFEEAEHLIELVSNMNELIDYCIDSEINIGEIEKFDLNNNDNLSERLNYMRVKLMIDTFDEIAKSHPEIFKLGKDESLLDYIEPNGGSKHYTFGRYSIREPVQRDLQSIIIDRVNSKEDAIITFVDNTSNNYQVMQLERSTEMLYKLTIHESSFYRESEDVNYINKLLKHKNFFSHLKNKCIKRLETYDQSKERMNKSLCKLADLVGLDIRSTNSEEIIESAKEKALKTDNKEERNKIIKQMNKYIDFHVHETIKISGKVPDEVFKTIYEHSIANNRVSIDSIKALDLSTSGNDYETNDINTTKKLENAANFNTKFSEGISSNDSNPHNELPKVSSVGENKHTPPHTPSPTHPGGNSGGSPTKPNHPVHTPIIHKRNKNNLLNRRDEIIKYIKIMY